MIRKLVLFIGHDDAARLRTEDVDRRRDHLLAELGSAGRARTPRTVRTKYLTALRATLNWAVEKRHLPRNVAAGVVVRVPKRTLLRQRDFTDTEVRAILQGAVAPYPTLRPELALARRWIPWICAYTGARVNEISQLRRCDIFDQDGIPVLRIAPDAGTVKTDVARVIPIHPHLLDQGLRSVISGRGEGPIFYDPDRARKPGPSNRYIKKVGEHLRDWIRDELGVSDPNVQPNHGWRHRFKTVMTELGIPERVADAIQGHAPRSVSQTYGHVSLATLKRAIDSIPRIEL
jgi:integrase